MANPNDILVSFQHPYKPTIINGIQCETGECAKWANNELRRNYPGMSIGGHAWNRFRYGQVNDPSAYSGYSGMSDNYYPRDNYRNFVASQRFAQGIDTTKLDKTRPYLLNMWYQGTQLRNSNQAYNEGYKSDNLGRITGTHTGNLYWNGNQWRVNHNMSGLIYDVPFYKTIQFNPKTQQFGQYNYIPTAAVPFGDISDFIGIKDIFAEHSPAPSDPNFERDYVNTFPKYRTTFTPEEIEEYILNPTKMYKEYPDGLAMDEKTQNLLASMGIYPTGEINYANITSPIIMTGLESAYNNSDELIQHYGITQQEFNQFLPLVMGILNQESNGGSVKYKTREGELKDNTVYTDKHLSPSGFLRRAIGDYVSPMHMSSTLGSVKLDGHNTLEYGNGLVDNPFEVADWNRHLYRDVSYSGPNVMSNLISNYLKLRQMLGDKENILFNERGGLSQLAKGLLLEAHNQGLDGNIKESINQYLQDGQEYHLQQYGRPYFFYHGDFKNAPFYASNILYNLNKGFFEYDDQQLPEVELTVGPNGYRKFTSGYVTPDGNVVSYTDIKQGNLTDSTATTSNNSYKSQKSKQKKQKSNQQKWKSNNRKRKRLVSKVKYPVPKVKYIE